MVLLEARWIQLHIKVILCRQTIKSCSYDRGVTAFYLCLSQSKNSVKKKTHQLYNHSILFRSFSGTIKSDGDHISFSSTGANVDLQMCLYKAGTTEKLKSLISQLLSPFGRLSALWTPSCELRAPSSTGTRCGNNTWYCSIHWVFKITTLSEFAGAKIP